MSPLSSSSVSDSDADLTPQTNPLINQPTQQPAADDDEVEESSDEDEEEEEEEELVNRGPIKTSPESGGTESDESESEPAQLVAPMSSKPMDELTDEPKKQLFQRLFSLEDEIAILKSLAEYQEKKGPMRVHAASIPDFRAFLGQSLTFEVRDVKLYEKIRRFKVRFDLRRKKDGGGKFNKEHDRVVYELSKKVWRDFPVEEHSRKRKKAAAAVSEKGEKKRARLEVRMRKRSVMGGEVWFLNEQVERMGNLEGIEEGFDGMIEMEKAREVDREIKKFQLREMKREAERMGLLKESFELIMEGLQRSVV